MRRRGRPSFPDVLTPAEWQVAHAVRHGLSNREIARRRGTSLDATRYHVANIVAKLGLASRAALRRWSGVPAASPLSRSVRDMTADIALGPIGQVLITVNDFAGAVAFYRDALRLPHLFTFGELAFFDCAGTRLLVTRPERDLAPGNSVLYFSVPDIHAAAASLEARGVTFQAAPHLIHRHDDGTEEWMAFFSDPEGNTHALMARVPPA